MQLSQVAAQMYTLRDHTKTPADIATTLKKVAAIGFQSIQVSAFGPIEESELVKLCAENNLTICATHEGAEPVFDTPEAIIERLQKLNCPHTAIGSAGKIPTRTKDEILDFCRRFESAAQKFEDAGLTLSHHNHHHEFRKVEGKTLLDYILENTQHVGLELDTYWVQYGGANPESWCRKAKGRLPLLHLKDYMITDDNKPAFCEVGNGTLEFPAIIKAAEESGCQWFIVEQDTTPGDPFDSLEISFNYIRDNLVS